MSIGDRILKLRKEAGLSQEAFAEKLGVSRQSVSKWETGSVMPDLNKLVAMCELFGVSSDYILYGKEEAAPAPELEEIYIGEEPAEVIPEEKVENIRNESDEPSRKTKIRAVAIVLAACLLFAAIIPLPLGGYKRLWAKFHEDPVTYPYVLVHGMGGWGESAESILFPLTGAQPPAVCQTISAVRVTKYTKLP